MSKRVFSAFLTLALFTSVIAGISITRANTQHAYAAAPATLNFQARLLNNSGAIVPDGDYNVEFKIYDHASNGGQAQGVCSGNCLWSDTYTGGTKVSVKAGYLSVHLGEGNALPTNIWDQQLYLTMRIGGLGSPSWDGEMTPRIKLTSVPYAFRATTATSADTLVQKTPGGFTGTVDFESFTTADRKFLFPDTSLATTASPGTICVYNGSTSNCPAATGSAYYIHNDTALQLASNFNMQARDSGVNGTVAGVLRGAAAGQTVDLLQFQATGGSVLAAVTAAGDLNVASTVDTYTGTTLNIGTANATAISIGDTGVTATVNGALTVTAALTSLTGGTTGDALNVSNSTSTGNIAVFKDNSTAVLTIADGGNITGTGTYTFSGPATDITTGTNEDLTLVANGTGGIKLNDDVTLGASAGSGTLLTNNGATLNATLAVADDSDGGALGGTPGTPLTAAQSVDIYTSIKINQTTAGQSITLPSPTNTAAGRILYVANVGSASFGLLGSTLNNGSTATLLWNGSAWTFAGADGTSINNQIAAAQNGDFWIQSGGSSTGIGRIDGKLLTPTIDTATGVALNIGTSGAVVTTQINLNQNTVVAAAKTFTVTSALTNLTGATTGDALNVSNSTSTGNIAVFKDNATAVLTIADGGGITGTGTYTFSGVSTDITTGTNEDLTVVANGSGVIVLNDNVTVAGTVTYSGAATDITTGTNEDLTVVANGSGIINLNDNVTVGGNITFAEGANRTLSVASNATANAAGYNMTLTAGAANGSTTGNTGGLLALQGGAAAGSGNNNGGDVTLQGGAGTGTGVQGLVKLASSVFTAATVQSFAANGTITQANIDNFSTVNISSSVVGPVTITVPTPLNSIIGRLLYVTVTGSNSIVLTTPGGTTFTMSPNTSATFIWNGTVWTNAGVDGGSNSYIQNQNSGDQTANFRISGTAQVNTSVISPLFKSLDSSGGGNSASVILQSGDQISGSGTSGNVTITSGNASSGNRSSGNVSIDAGTKAGSGTTGTLSLGTVNASAIALGYVGVTTTVQGSLTVGSSAGSGTVFTNNGATLYGAKVIANDSDGGSLGGTPGTPLTAAQSVDIYTNFTVNQTTANQSITIPNPTNTAAGRLIYIANIGSASFGLLGSTLNNGSTATLLWNGSAWTFAGADGTSINNQIAAAQNGDFWIQSGGSSTGIGRIDGKLLTPTIDTATGVALNIGTSGAVVTTQINLNQNTVVAAAKTFTVTSALTNLTGATTGDALNVSNSTSTGNIAVFKDNATAVLTIADGGGITGTGTYTFSGVTIDITTGTNEDLTIDANGTGKVVINDNLDISSSTSLATKVGTTFTAAGTSNNAALNGAGFYLLDTAGSAQVINGITAGRDGQQLTLTNVDATLSVTLTNNSGSATGSKIITGSAVDVVIPVGGSASLVYDSANTVWRVVSGGTGSGVELQASTPGTAQTGNFNISGTGIAGTALLTPTLDTASAVALNIGTSGAVVTTQINLNQNTVVAAGKTLTVTSALTSLTGATTGDALVVSNSTSTGNIAVFKDNGTAVFTIADGGGITGTGTYTFSGVTTDLTTGTNEDLTVDANGTGKFIVNDNTTIGASAGSGTLFTNNGATLNAAKVVANDADGGALGGTPSSPLTAAQSVDIYTSFTVNQTTANQTITLPSPTTTTAGRIIYIANIGSASFGLLGSTLNNGSTATLLWNGTAWTFAGADGTSINNQFVAGQNGDFWIQSGGSSTGVGRADGGFLAPTLDVASAGALGLGNTTATSVSICNSANCDTISLGTNADADTIQIGDSLDTLTFAGTLGMTGNSTFTGSTTGDALTVSNSTSTGNIAVFKDNATAVLTIADGGGITGTGSYTFSGVATDITTGTNEDLTVVANGTGIINLNDNVTVGGNITFAQGANRTESVAVNSSNGAGYNLTVSAGAAGAGASAFGGGVLTLQGGGAAGTGNANGGAVTIAGGAGVGTGTQGLINLSTSAFTSASEQSFASSTSITAGNVDLYSSLPVKAITNAGSILTIPDPAQTGTVGRLLYIAARSGSLDFTLRLNSTRAPIDITMKQNSTATLIWNGTDWTAAGASSSTDLQAAYNNTLTSAGGAELVLNAPGGAADGFTIRNNATTPITGALLEVQTSVGSNILSVNNNATEYASNGGAETVSFTGNWTASPNGGTTATVARTTTAGEFATGIAAVKVTAAGASTNQGAADQIAVNGTNTALSPNLTYSVSFTVKSSVNFSTLDVVYSKDGTNTATTTCATGKTATESVWSRVSCTFTAPSSGITSSNAIFIRQSDSGTSRIFYIDNLSVNVNANTNHAADGTADSAANIGGGTLNWAAVNSSTVAQSTSILYDTAGSVGVTTAATATRGVYNKLSNNIAPSTTPTQYRVAFYARGDGTNGAVLGVSYTPNNGTNSIACKDYSTQTIVATNWTLVSCYFTTDATAVSNAQIRIVQNSGSATVFYVDALSVTLNTNNSNNVQIGGGNQGGPTALLTLDRASSAPIAANNDAYLGSMYYDTTTGRIQCYEADGWGACGSSPDAIITLTPEYTGAVLGGPGQVGTGSAQTPGIGVMTSEFCSKETNILQAYSGASNLCATHEARNFYHWTSPQATQQIYSIYVAYKLPTTFKAFNDSNTVKLTALSDNNTNAIATLHLFRKKADGSGITSCGSANSDQTINTTTNTWQQTSYDIADETTCNFAGGDNIIFKIDMKSTSNGNIYVENLDFVYTNN